MVIVAAVFIHHQGRR